MDRTLAAIRYPVSDGKEEAWAVLRVMQELIERRKAGIRGRDAREPDRLRKEQLEKKIKRAVGAMFARQAGEVEKRLSAASSLSAVGYSLSAKAAGTPPIDDLFDGEDPEAEGELIRYVLETRGLGVANVAQAVGVSVDWTGVNAAALAQARLYVGTLIKGIDATSLEAVRKAVSMFVETPGFTMGDLVKALPFDEERAWMVGVTEVTRAYADGQLAAMDEISKEFPSLRITKTWFTNADDLVCPACGPLDGVEIGIEDLFEGEIGQPPAHPRCRCWMSTGAKADDGVGAEDVLTPNNPGKSPFGPAVSNALNIPKGEKAYAETTQAIDQVHGDGALPNIPVVTIGSKSTNGSFYTMGGRPGKISISSKGDHPHMTLAHEIGHFIDFSGIGANGVFTSSTGDPLMSEWKDAVKNSNAYKRWAEIKKKKVIISQETGEVIANSNPAFVRYSMDYKEFWARSYAQYIAEKSSNPAMLLELEKTVSYKYPSQWETEDFKPIKSAIDNLFERLGWIK